MSSLLDTKIAQFVADSDITHDIVHGANTATVTTEGGQVRTFAKIDKDALDAFNAAQAARATTFNASVNGQADTAINQAQKAVATAASAVALNQDLTGVLDGALYRSPNALSTHPLFVYNTGNDTDGGAWIEKCGHLSYANEPLNGTWLGPKGTELLARYKNATLGSELLTNGAFDSGITGWTVVNAQATLSYAPSKALRITIASSTAAHAYAPVTTVVGQTYRLVGTSSNLSASATHVLYAGTSIGGQQLGYALHDTGTGTGVGVAFTGSPELIFTATTTTTYIGVGITGVVGNFVDFDNLSVKQVTAVNTVSGDYSQLGSDGKFYRLWKNILKSTAVLNDAAWNGNTNFTTTLGFTDPDGGTTAARLTATGVNANKYQSFVTVLSAVPATNSIWARRVSGTGNVLIQAPDGTTVTNITGTIDGTWRKFTSTTTVGFTGGIYFGASITVATSGDVIEVAFPQLELGAATSTYELKAVGDGSQTETFRGNKTKPPKLWGIVAEAARLAIFDLLEPGRPMWMVFSIPSSTTTIYGRGAFWAFKSLYALGGELVMGSNSNSGAGETLVRVNFAKDTIDLYAVGLSTGRASANIANRNSTAVNYSGPNNTNLAGITAADIAMAVMPDAPIDPATGLAVPTIAVATAGGVSFIKHDGSVVSPSTNVIGSCVTMNQYAAYVERDGTVVSYYLLQPGKVTAATPFVIIGNGFAPDLNVGAVAGKNALSGRGTMAAIRQGSNLQFIRHNESTIANSPTARITPTHNTGWMIGDIRRCLLSDTVPGSTTGTELVTNGTFNSDIVGWTAFGATLSWQAGGFLRAVCSGVQGAYQSFTTVPGMSYSLTVTNLNTSTGNGYFRAGTAINGFQNADSTVNIGATATVLFTATATTTFITFGAVGGSTTMDFDNVSVKGVSLDRTYKAKSVTTSGTITKTAVATAAQLVGYSGFSTANYLQEIYSADLDFGTGGWHVSAMASAPTTLLGSGITLITNGTFPTNTTGWTAGNGGTLSVSSGQLQVQNDGTGTQAGYAFQTLTVVVGKTYRLTVDQSNGTGTTRQTRAGTAANSASYGSITTAGTGQTLTFTASNTNLTITCTTNTSNASITSLFDNIIVEEVPEMAIIDRSNATGASIRMSITGAGFLSGTVFDGTTTRTVTSTMLANTGVYFRGELIYATDGSLTLRYNGQQIAQAVGAPLLSLSRYNIIGVNTEDVTSGWTLGNVTATTIDTITGNASIAVHSFVPNSFYALETTVAGVQYEVTFEAKAGTSTVIQLSGSAGAIGTNSAINFNLGAGTIGTITGSSLTGQTITSVGSGWYRCRALFTCGLNGAGATSLSQQDADTAGYQATSAASRTIQFRKMQVVRATPWSGVAYQQVGGSFTGCPLLTIGQSSALTNTFGGSIAQVKLSATVPTAEQSLFTWEQEKQMLRPSAIITLPDTGALVDVVYDQITDQFRGASATNEWAFNGLIRSSVQPSAGGNLVKLNTGAGAVLKGRTTLNPGVDVSIPAQNLKEEVLRRGDDFRKYNPFTPLVEVLDFVGGTTATTTSGSAQLTVLASSLLPGVSTIYPITSTVIGAAISGTGIPAGAFIQTVVSATVAWISAPATASGATVNIAFLDYILPVGYEARAVLVNGTLKQEGASKDYVRRWDGYRETIRFAVAPGATAWVQIQVVRKPA